MWQAGVLLGLRASICWRYCGLWLWVLFAGSKLHGIIDIRHALDGKQLEGVPVNLRDRGEVHNRIGFQRGLNSFIGHRLASEFYAGSKDLSALIANMNSNTYVKGFQLKQLICFACVPGTFVVCFQAFFQTLKTVSTDVQLASYINLHS